MNHDRQTTLDAALLPARTRETILQGYRDLAAMNRVLYAESRSPRHLREAVYAEGKVAEYEYGGRISLAALFLESEP